MSLKDLEFKVEGAGDTVNGFYMKTKRTFSFQHMDEKGTFQQIVIDKRVYEANGEFHLNCFMNCLVGGDSPMTIVIDDGIGSVRMSGKDFHGSYYYGVPILVEGIMPKSVDQSNKAIKEIFCMFDKLFMGDGGSDGDKAVEFSKPDGDTTNIGVNGSVSSE